MSANFINEIVVEKYGRKHAAELLEQSHLLKYLKLKTKSVDSSSKARGSFANLYALYVLIEDYMKKGYLDRKDYQTYEGMIFSEAFKRQRELPFGEKLQNHALNNRLNDEFRKYFVELGEVPIARDLKTKRYWVNENLLVVKTSIGEVNIAPIVLQVIDQYVQLKLNIFQSFFSDCEHHKFNYREHPDEAEQFILDLLHVNVDARIFEIVSFVILKYFYRSMSVHFGKSPTQVREVPLTLYKTGRTNANDGGIDYLMQPLGKVFQVTEVLDFRKYFLDIDKLNKFPITFVVKSEMTPIEAFSQIENQARDMFQEDSLLQKYLDCFEELITIPILKSYLRILIEKGDLGELLEELVVQCKVEYNIHDEW